MTIKKAIQEADKLRPNTLDDIQKAKFVYELDCQFAEMMGTDKPEFVFPTDSELLLNNPDDNVYVLYLCSMIDYYNQESGLYQNDTALYNQKYAEVVASYRRSNTPNTTKQWKVM